MRKKLIEVALPLEAINAESAREKSIRHGHPSTLHLWWARRPLAACRAVLWASLVDDPSSWPDRFPTEEEQKQERQRLFDILARFETVTDKKGKTKRVVRGLVSWNDINDVDANGEVAVLIEAQREIARCLAWARDEEPPTESEAVRAYIAEYAPPAYDPFAGGGSIPLEAQRLGLEAHASDLNPVAVLINKALIEIPPKFKDMPPVNPEAREKLDVGQWRGAQGLAEDVRYYGKWMRDEAFKRIGHLYPKVRVIRKEDGSYDHAPKDADPKAVEELTVIAWLWARTVKCPNPACGCQMPLIRNFQLSTKKGQEVWLKPVIERHQVPPKVQFEITTSQLENGLKGTVERRGAKCIVCGTDVQLEYIRQEGHSKRLSQTMIAIVTECNRKRILIRPCPKQEKISSSIQANWKPEFEITPNSRYMTPTVYGMTQFSDLFTQRQLLSLSVLVDLLFDVPQKIEKSTKDSAYISAVFTYLGLAISKLTDTLCALATWQPNMTRATHAFTRQALPISWDYVETNIFNNSAGDYYLTLYNSVRVLDNLPKQELVGNVFQCDAREIEHHSKAFLFSSDPPYYDAVPYADLSDFFYVWLRKIFKDVNADLFRTILTPKENELVADPIRLGNKQKAKENFENGLTDVFSKIHGLSVNECPTSVYYAFKQSENIKNSKDEAIGSTGWETMIEGLIHSKFSIIGTWPLRTELSNRVRGQGSNALASSIVLVCRPRPTNATKITRRQFLSELKRQLPKALKTLQQGNIAPVDLAQASIGPGMAIFSKYTAVLESDGSPMRVRTALQLINQILDEFLTDQEGEFDADTRWALTWYEQYQFYQAPYGEAETLSKAKNTSVQGLVDAGILEAVAGKVRLLPRTDLPENWDPSKDNRLPDWEATQHLIHRLDTQGEVNAAKLLGQLGDQGENARDLAYRLYTLCDRKGWSKEGLAYNSLVIAWPEISRLATEYKPPDSFQTTLEV